jgi:thiol-disulfide isomerase/thioredoxin
VTTRGVVVVVAALCALAGCGGGSGEPEAGATPAQTAMTAQSEPTRTPRQTASSAPTSAAPAPAVPDVLDFTVATVDGGTFAGTDLAGKPAVIWFWAPWCPVCKQGAADVTAAAAELGGDVAFVGVAGLSGSVEDMQAFVDDTGSGSIPHIADVDGTVFTRFEVAQQDTFAFVGTDGTVTLIDGYSADPDLVGTARELFGL